MEGDIPGHGEGGFWRGERPGGGRIRRETVAPLADLGGVVGAFEGMPGPLVILEV